jgi:hypothetical protein
MAWQPYRGKARGMSRGSERKQWIDGAIGGRPLPRAGSSDQPPLPRATAVTRGLCETKAVAGTERPLSVLEIGPRPHPDHR